MRTTRDAAARVGQEEAVERPAAPAVRAGGSAATPSVATSPASLRALQTAAGNSAVHAYLLQAGLVGARPDRTGRAAARAVPRVAVARQATGTIGAPAPSVPSARPDLRLGDVSQMVGVAQQKLVATGAGADLAIDAEFGSRTHAAVLRSQRRNGLARTGVVDAATWGVLDQLAPGGVLDADGRLSPVHGANRPDPTAPPPSPTSDVHPVLRLGSRGVAVAELHEKLNVAQGSALLLASGLDAADAVEFTAETDQAVRAFQTSRGLGLDGIVGRKTWRALDTAAPGSAVGRTDRIGTEQARGMSFGGPVQVDWALEPDRVAPERLRVRVRYQFDDDPDPARAVDRTAEIGALLAGIDTVWNRFKVQERALVPGTERPPVRVEFEPREESPPDQRIMLSKGPGKSNSAHYFIDPATDRVLLGAHEFGHHIGLQDEYQQTAADHLRQTGTVAPVGAVTGSAPPRDIAMAIGRELRTAPRATHGDRALAVIEQFGLQQGAFAQQVALRYRNVFGTSVVADCNRLVDDRPDEGSLTVRRRCTHPFLYNEPGLMAGAEMEDPATGGANPGEPDHRHSVEPRHVREYADIVGRALGGVWEPAVR